TGEPGARRGRTIAIRRARPGRPGRGNRASQVGRRDQEPARRVPAGRQPGTRGGRRRPGRDRLTPAPGQPRCRDPSLLTCGCLASYPRIPMYGFKLRYVKKSVLLLAALIALVLAWNDLSRAFLVLITVFAAILVGGGWLARNALAQTSADDSRSAR